MISKKSNLGHFNGDTNTFCTWFEIHFGKLKNSKGTGFYLIEKKCEMGYFKCGKRRIMIIQDIQWGTCIQMD